MTTYLLDVNLLLALSDAMHTYHLFAPEGLEDKVAHV